MPGYDLNPAAGRPLFPRALLDALDERVQALVQPIVDRVGYFGDFFAVLGQNPGALLAFMDYTKAVKAPLPERLNEVIALTVCHQLAADYERIQHERVSSRLGFERQWIARLIGHPEGQSVTLAPDESLMVQLAQELLSAPRATNTAALIDAARQRLGDEAALAAVLQVARFQMIATLVNAFGLELPIASTFESGAVSVPREATKTIAS